MKGTLLHLVEADGGGQEKKKRKRSKQQSHVSEMGWGAALPGKTNVSTKAGVAGVSEGLVTAPNPSCTSDGFTELLQL